VSPCQQYEIGVSGAYFARVTFETQQGLQTSSSVDFKDVHVQIPEQGQEPFRIRLPPMPAITPA
jgi:hypothetical protein